MSDAVPTQARAPRLGEHLDQIRAGLHLDATGAAWLSELASFPLPVTPLVLPGPRRSAEILERLACPPEAVADAVATLPGPERDPERFFLLERCRARLLAGMGQPGLARGAWPQLPKSLGVPGGCFYLHLVLALFEDVRAEHRRLGVPDDVSWATLADLGRHVAIQRASTGRTGVDEPWWMTLHLRAILIEVGRLQYSTFRLGEGPESPLPWYDDAAAERLGEGLRPGDATLGIHIPAGEPLSPAACAQSLARAGELSAAIWPVATRRVATCCSWLLDDQLAGMLGPSSNIVAFQQRFVLVPGAVEGDHDVRTFVFRSMAPLDQLSATTSLQRAVLTHLRAGGHFLRRTGWVALDEEA
ncbi:MAG: acyltransferase domain-containing protein [Actinomycetota bacterium]|nr:acyltransferase domain-containing protein [Actinomycetota bacterium]